MKKLLLPVIIALFALTSCKKDYTQANNYTCTTAKVQYGGDPQAGGLDWILVTDTANFVFEAPENLDAAYKIEGLLVDVCYYRTNIDFVCRICGEPKKLIHLTSINVH